MQYKIVNLRVKNFKCFDDTQFYEFRIEYEKNPIILSGPNGFGKTTFFDAIELIFSKNITRIDKGIEKKTTNLGKNILLNKANEDGYVVLTLRNEQSEFLTIFAKILNNNHKLEVEDSIYYGEISGFISTDELDSFLCSYDDWKDFVDNENLIKYRAKNFNVYYYVSQAESVHFLKRTISDRKNAMNVLLNTGFIDDRKNVVIDLIGSRNGTSGHLINDEIMTLDSELKKKAAILKALSKSNMQTEVEKIEYVDLGLYNKDSNLYFWDTSSAIDSLIQRKTSLKGFISDSGRVANVEKVVKYLATAEYAAETEGNNLVIDIQRVLSGLVKNIENQEFDNLYIKHKYEKVEELYGEDIKNMMKQMTVEKLKKKFKYLEKVVWEKENTEIHEIKREMKDLIVRKEKVTRIRQQLNELSKVYDKSVEEYKNITLKQLRVPLLIYTGKILQDYQNGLGVFASKDEMRFVSNGDAKHDILNTFSSGQLSGFVLAFLFAMNKQYIKASSDDIGFILIDDPVQTMDDINISSLIEVLRNDFSDKQIILSTHEMDKENYILYKFYKYNKIGQSFNVKEEIYG